MAGTVSILFASSVGAGTYPSTGSKLWKGGKLALVATATTWTTSSVQFNALINGKVIPVGTAFTADGMQVVELPPCELNVVGTGAALAGLTVEAVEVPTNTRH